MNKLGSDEMNNIYKTLISRDIINNNPITGTMNIFEIIVIGIVFVLFILMLIYHFKD